jgi:hypothetical protein
MFSPRGYNARRFQDCGGTLAWSRKIASGLDWRRLEGHEEAVDAVDVGGAGAAHVRRLSHGNAGSKRCAEPIDAPRIGGPAVVGGRKRRRRLCCGGSEGSGDPIGSVDIGGSFRCRHSANGKHGRKSDEGCCADGGCGDAMSDAHGAPFQLRPVVPTATAVAAACSCYTLTSGKSISVRVNLLV